MMEVIDGVELEHRDIVTNGVRLHCVVAGPEDGHLVIALHGFPEFWRGMSGVVTTLARAGFRVVAPDQRGYNLSERPKGMDAYRIQELTADVVGLIHACGRERADIVGHDWGAAVAWWVALTRPEVVRRLVVVNVPHPNVLAKEIRTNRQQTRKSWYIFAFQIPWLPQHVAFGRFSRPAMAHMLVRTSNPGAFSPTYLGQLMDAWGQPGAGEAMINWYRAITQRPPDKPADPRVHVPTLIIWGRKDMALSDTMVAPSAALCDDVRVEMFDEATHWVLHDEPVRTGDVIVGFLADETTPGTAPR